MNDRLPFLRDKASKLPTKPGVYLMKNADGGIIYVGKAKALKNRVSSYFQNVAKHTAKTFKLVTNIYDFDFIVTGSELDALVLEKTLIKQHTPKYNILLKDDKGLNYIKVSKESYPRITYALQTSDRNADYIGPYASTYTIKQAVQEANRIFILPSCNKKFPRDFRKERPCLNYQIKRCMGVCLGKIDEASYQKQVNSALEYIKSGSKKSIERLTSEMEAAAESLDFERAAKLRDQIKSIEKTEGTQKIQSKKTTDYDIIGFAQNIELASVAVIKYRGGKIVDKENFYIGDEYDEGQMRSDFIMEYYDRSDSMPREIYVDHDMDDTELLEEYFTDKFGHKISFVFPKRGEGLTQVTLAKSNASEYLAIKVGRTAKEINALEGLARLLGLPKIPTYIESYDISNLGDSHKVGGMIVYRNGRPFKAGYRKFSIKDVVGQDDYACMSEVIHRRFSRYLEGDEAFSILPDLILLDGGKGHISVAKQVLSELGLDEIPLFGLVKDDKHRTRAIAKEGGEIAVSANKQVFQLITNIQDEVHRFSISFQRQTHGKKTYELQLTKAPGIGDKKAMMLIKTFKTKQRLKEATPEELHLAAKIPLAKAELLHQFIKENL